MRTLDRSELVTVSGGSDPQCTGPVVQGEDVVVTGRRPRHRMPISGSTVIEDRFDIEQFISDFSSDRGGQSGSWLLAAAGGAGGGGGGHSSGLGDTVIGYPVDHHSENKDITDYEKQWKAVFDKMSPAELKAFDNTLKLEYEKAMKAYNFGLAEKIMGFLGAAAAGNSAKMGVASSYAAQNMSQVNLGLLEGAITRAYAVAAALPGGI